MHVFDRMIQQGHIWVKDMAAALGTDDAHMALHALRAGLQALRDRLPLDEVAQLSSQLPLVVRGVYFENWKPGDKPLRIRHKREFLALVEEKYVPRRDLSGGEILAALFKVLERHVAKGELTDVMLTLPDELAMLIAGRESSDKEALRG